ncbi:MAG TPA: tetratricopeptide repeat protein, partial [Thermoplasmata archaeon]|nr:tetratricopeptide repeat protein [Thermoplasmata archaeon]
EARASFERATAADPSDADAWANLAAVLNKEGRSEEALAACERALSADAASGIALNNKGVILASVGREAEARVALEAAAKCTEEPVVVVNQAMLAEAGDRLRAALALVDDAIASFPEEDGLEAARRRVLGRLGARERASRDRLVARIAAIPGLGEATAHRIVRAGYDSSAKLRRARESELREAAGITKAQAHAVCRAFRA